MQAVIRCGSMYCFGYELCYLLDFHYDTLFVYLLISVLKWLRLNDCSPMEDYVSTTTMTNYSDHYAIGTTIARIAQQKFCFRTYQIDFCLVKRMRRNCLEFLVD
jgi:hypothetical protein